MAGGREEAAARRKSAKASCTSLRKAVDKAVDEGRDPELLQDNVDRFKVAYDKLLRLCDEVTAFDDESGDEEKDSIAYKERILVENDAILYKYKVYLQKFKEAKTKKADKEKQSDKLDEQKKVYNALVEDLGRELINIGEKSNEGGYSPVLLQERWKTAKESKEKLFGMFTSILGQSEDCLLYTSPSPRD